MKAMTLPTMSITHVAPLHLWQVEVTSGDPAKPDFMMVRRTFLSENDAKWWAAGEQQRQDEMRRNAADDEND
jgi:hypothetical protein